MKRQLSLLSLLDTQRATDGTEAGGTTKYPRINDVINLEEETRLGSESSDELDNMAHRYSGDEELDREIPGLETSQCSHTTSASSNFSVDDIAAGPAVPPVQPKHIKFPAVVISGKSRCFLTKWYGDYEWLEYSMSYDAMFCYPCRFFAVGNKRAEKTFTEYGYRNWKHA